jgi:DNA invertase Pin-like site-specific DNA recombinase
MLLDAKQHHFDALIFWTLNQLTRQNANNTILLLHKLSCWNVGFCSYTERHLDSCHTSRETVFAIIALLVEQNSVYIGEKTRIGIEKQQQMHTPGPNGRFGPGRPPAVFDQERAQELRARGKSYTTIATVCGVSKATISRYFKEAREHSV